MRVNNTASFIAKSTAIHGEKYEYTRTSYKGSTQPVSIYCKRHQEFFLQRASSHLEGNGCPKCGKHLTTESFIGKAREIHGDQYDYSKTEYVNNVTKVTITCHEHGDFTMKPNRHTSSLRQGCPKCGHKRAGLSRRKHHGA